MRAEEHHQPPSETGHGQPTWYGPRPGEPRWRSRQGRCTSNCSQHGQDTRSPHGTGPVLKRPIGEVDWAEEPQTAPSSYRSHGGLMVRASPEVPRWRRPASNAPQAASTNDRKHGVHMVWVRVRIVASYIEGTTSQSSVLELRTVATSPHPQLQPDQAGVTLKDCQSQSLQTS